jgi:hypothetical protein
MFVWFAIKHLPEFFLLWSFLWKSGPLLKRDAATL